MAELARVGARAAVEPAVDEQADPDAGPGQHDRRRRRLAVRPELGERGRVRVLVEQHRQSGPLLEQVAQRHVVPAGHVGRVAHVAGAVVERADRADTEAEDPAFPQLPGRRSDGGDGVFGREARPERATGGGHDLAGQVGPEHPELVAVEPRAERVPGVRTNAQQRARLADPARGLAFLGEQAGIGEFGDDLRDGLLGEPGALGQLDAAQPACPQDVPQQQGAVVLAQAAQVDAGFRHSQSVARHGQLRNTVV